MYFLSAAIYSLYVRTFELRCILKETVAVSLVIRNDSCSKGSGSNLRGSMLTYVRTYYDMTTVLLMWSFFVAAICLYVIDIMHKV